MEESVSYHILTFITFTYNDFQVSTVLEVITLFGLLALSALVSGSETAFFSFAPADLKILETEEKPVYTKILQLLKDPNRLLATILVANNFINVGIVLLTAFLVDQLLSFSSPTWAFFFNTVFITFLILLSGEVIPKVYASKKPIVFGSATARLIGFLEKLFLPLSSLLVSGTRIIDKRLKKKKSNVSMDGLSDALEITDTGGLKEENKKMLKGIVKFGNTDVAQIMTPRVDVMAIEIETSFDVLMDQLKDGMYSRVPIFKESFDSIEGILFLKDILPFVNETKHFDWHSLMREPFFVPESKKIDDLLQEFQERKSHLAIVVDEYGGNSGIITLEDIIEEIVGDISDEFDDDEIQYSKLDDHNYIFEGKTNLNDMYRVLGIDGKEFESEKGESNSLAGFILEQVGKIPRKNEKINFKSYVFTIDAAEPRRIKRIKITLPNEQ